MADQAENIDITAMAAAHKRAFQGFLNVEDDRSKYGLRIAAMMEEQKRRLIIDINDLREALDDLTSQVQANPTETLPILEAAVKEIVLDRDPGYLPDKAAKIAIGFEGTLRNTVTPRTLSAEYLGQLVALEGIVTKCSLVRPKAVKTVHFCPATGQFESRSYRDATDTSGAPTGNVYPTKDKDGNLLETEFGLSTYKDSQTFAIQEMPESAPLGQLPRSVDVYLENDLVDLVKPGDRVRVVGAYRALTSAATGVTSGVFRTTLIANAVRKISRDTSNVTVTEQDIKHIRKVSQRQDVFELMSRSLAPSIYGHKHVKRALTLLLLGGREHNLANGTHIRGDINILMVGDPSTAKSQLLRFVLNLAPLAVNTTGRGSSGVGLTAAVTTDTETGERRLEAGAMVLADRGVVCIDEFDKMSDADRVAIHEVMEQQTVTIAKAGIQASLNARCSVVAAANPIYGRFDNTLPLHRNVALPDSLLSRFDLLFIVRDRIDTTIDGRLADHVLRMHRYVKPGQEGIPMPLDASAEGREDDRSGAGPTEYLQKYNPLLHGGAAAEVADSGKSGTGKQQVELLTLDFIRKYVSFAKSSVNPVLDDEARAAIVECYNEFRQKAKDRATVITARSLETLIRLSTAHAKLRLSRKVAKKDAAVAYEIMHFALYGDAKVRSDEGARSAVKGHHGVTPGARPKRDDDDGADGRPDEDDVSEAGDKRKRQPRTPPVREPEAEPEVRTPPRAKKVPLLLTSSGTPDAPPSPADLKAAAQIPVDEASDEFSQVVAGLGKYFHSTRSDSVTELQLLEYLRSTGAAGSELGDLSRARLSVILRHLDTRERVMYTDGIIHNVA